MSTPYATIAAAEERERLILEHLPQVRWIASGIAERLPRGASEEDLISAGVLGLIAAIDNFDPARNASLRTYAEIRIRGAILDSVRGLDGVPAHKRKLVRQVQEVIATLEQRFQRTPTEEEIAAELRLSVSEYQDLLHDTRGVTLGSLDSVGDEGSDGGLLRYIADDRVEAPCVLLERTEMQRLLAEGIAAMPQTEQTVLDLYYTEELTLAEIGQVMSLHPSRISQLKTQALLRLRTWMERRLSLRRRVSGA